MSLIKQENPTVAEPGSLRNIVSISDNFPHLNIVLSSTDGCQFLENFLAEFECLLGRYVIDKPKVFRGRELQLFVALFTMNSKLQELRS